MQLPKGRRPSPALVISILALFIALGGTATALRGKNTVRSDDIAKGQVKSSDIRSDAVLGRHIRNGEVAGADVNDASITGADLKDASITGADVGADALTGKEVQESSLIGVRPYGDVIPSGTTVIGLWGGGAATGNASVVDFLVNLPAPAPVPLAETTVNFADNGNATVTDADPSCTGSVDAPTAPPGKVCLYAGGNVGGNPSVRGDTVGDPLSDRLGFIVLANFDSTLVDMIEAHGTWAYTAP